MRKISIVIPSYNCSTLLHTAIDSALAQTHENIEIIVVDDGSNDDTHEAVARYSSDSRVKYIFQENIGVPGARNTGIAEATGDYIAFLDADDEWHPQLLEICLNRMEIEDADFCITDILRIEETVDGFKKEVYISEIPACDWKVGILEGDFIKRMPLVRIQALIDVGPYDERLFAREDWDINLRLIMAGKRFCYVREPLYIYKIRGGSLTKGKKKRVFDCTRILLHKHHKQLADSGNRIAAQIYSVNMWRLAHDYMVEARAYTAGAACLIESLRYDFNISRLLHPFLFHAKRFVAGKQTGTDL